jgi:hypothetical protein
MVKWEGQNEGDRIRRGQNKRGTEYEGDRIRGGQSMRGTE